MSTHARRFDFPGFTPVCRRDTSTHEVEVGKITVGGEVLVVHMIRRFGLRLPGGGDFLVAKVFYEEGDTLLWEFPKGAFDGIGLLARAGEETVIALVVGGGRDRVVKDIIPLSVIRTSQIELRRKMELKRRAAEFLGCDVVFSAVERLVSKREQERLRLEREAAEEEKRREEQEAYEARRAVHKEFVSSILSRGELLVYTKGGLSRRGVPTTAREWMSLPHGTFVVLVESYDEDARKAGAPVESFRVLKSGGGRRPEKGSSAPVTLEKPEVKTAPPAPSPIGSMAVEIEDGVFEILVFATMDEVRRARETGLNHGAFVTAKDQVAADGRIPVFSIHSGGVKTVGLFAPIA